MQCQGPTFPFKGLISKTKPYSLLRLTVVVVSLPISHSLFPVGQFSLPEIPLTVTDNFKCQNSEVVIFLFVKFSARVHGGAYIPRNYPFILALLCLEPYSMCALVSPSPVCREGTHHLHSLPELSTQNHRTLPCGHVFSFPPMHLYFV